MKGRALAAATTRKKKSRALPKGHPMWKVHAYAAHPLELVRGCWFFTACCELHRLYPACLHMGSRITKSPQVPLRTILSPDGQQIHILLQIRTPPYVLYICFFLKPFLLVWGSLWNFWIMVAPGCSSSLSAKSELVTQIFSQMLSKHFFHQAWLVAYLLARQACNLPLHRPDFVDLPGSTAAFSFCWRHLCFPSPQLPHKIDVCKHSKH